MHNALSPLHFVSSVRVQCFFDTYIRSSFGI